MDQVFLMMLTKLQERREVGDLDGIELESLTECLELLEKAGGDISEYVKEVAHLKKSTGFYVKIAENRRNRDLEIAFGIFATNYFRWWPTH